MIQIVVFLNNENKLVAVHVWVTTHIFFRAAVNLNIDYILIVYHSEQHFTFY